jgi:hypothetical protein
MQINVVVAVLQRAAFTQVIERQSHCAFVVWVKADVEWV